MRYFRFQRGMMVKLVVSLSLLSIVILVSLTFVLFSNFKQHAQDIMTESSVKALSQISYSANYMNENVRNLAFYLFYSEQIQRMMYGNQELYDSETNKEMKKLHDFIRMNSFVQSVYIYQKKTDSVVSIASENIHFKSGYFQGSFFDKGIMELLKGEKLPRKFYPIPRTITLDNGQSMEVLSYIVYDIVSSAGEIEAALIVNVEPDYLKQIMSSINDPGAAGETIVVNGQGQALNNSTLYSFLDNIQDEELYQRMDPESKVGHFFQNIDGQKRLVSYVSTEGLDWKYISTVDYETLSGGISKLRWFSFIIGIVFICTASFLLVIIVRQIYRPIGDFIGKVAVKTGTLYPPSHDETTFLSQVFNTMADKAERNEQLLRSKQELERQEKLRHLLHNSGQVRPGALGYQPNDTFLLVVLRVDRYEQFCHNYNTSDRKLIKYALLNASEEIFNTVAGAETVDMEDDQLVVLMNASNLPALYPEKLSAAIQEFQMWTQTYLHCSLTACTAYDPVEFAVIHEGYEWLLDQSNNRFTMGHGALIVPSLDSESDLDPIRSVEIRKIADALRAGKIADAQEQLEQLAADIKGGDYETASTTMTYLSYEVFNFLHTMENNSLIKVKTQYKLFIREISELETVDEVIEKFRTLFGQIDEVIKEWKSSKSSVIVTSIARTIEQNYSDKSLCLDVISAQLNMSKVYVGKIFRDAYGKSVADYITDLRINQTIELLHKGRTNLSDILDEVGIENKNYFYKLFKVRVGVSFSEYKLKHFSELKTDED